MSRPTTPDSLKKMGFTVIEFDSERYWARLEYKGQRTALRGDSAKELLSVARGWIQHISSTS